MRSRAKRTGYGLSAEEANAKNLACGRGHVANWSTLKIRKTVTRYCKDCSKGQHFKKAYGLSRDDVEFMIGLQGGLCAICNAPEKLCVDHCHATGRVRGMLCTRCNMMLGFIESGFAELGQEYLRTH